MSSLDSSIQERREVLIKSIQKKKEDEAQNELPRDDDNKDTEKPESLIDQVEDSIHALVRLGYDFDTIFKGSKVNRSFLEQAFQELGYCKLKPDLDIITSDDENDEESSTPENGKRSIQVEIQLFMMRVQLEINKLTAALDQEHDETRLNEISLKDGLRRKKQSLIESLNGLFDKLAAKEDEMDTRQKRKNESSDQDGLGQAKDESNSNTDKRAPGILVDSGFVKIARVC
ncbi:hypothetical protein ZYGR_0AI04890 [Zygosaccharomyces rouxii]|uniref:Uncharacterized protein n=1 Tax=Zygosaccharomyces rouxii TaxID=4956 RepID=A0A1Q3AC63_ZYGRO|nr:hypothetical protein ZYGR_0AI04890 [Zygosaccharomyces rouxii]